MGSKARGVITSIRAARACLNVTNGGGRWPQSQPKASRNGKEKSPEREADPISATLTNAEETARRASLLAPPMGPTSPSPQGNERAETEA